MITLLTVEYYTFIFGTF